MQESIQKVSKLVSFVKNGGKSTIECNESPSMINELAHDKNYNKTCVTSKDSGQPVHPPSMARFLLFAWRL